jgi:cation transport regulator ChaB
MCNDSDYDSKEYIRYKCRFLSSGVRCRSKTRIYRLGFTAQKTNTCRQGKENRQDGSRENPSVKIAFQKVKAEDQKETNLFCPLLQTIKFCNVDFFKYCNG